uniref:Uncharacterized protein n=1 Tax=Cacopsylla melanoneura TaxID=428564 RepID=A0A8D9BM53_9HEMI
MLLRFARTLIVGLYGARDGTMQLWHFMCLLFFCTKHLYNNNLYIIYFKSFCSMPCLDTLDGILWTLRRYCIGWSKDRQLDRNTCVQIWQHYYESIRQKI